MVGDEARLMRQDQDHAARTPGNRIPGAPATILPSMILAPAYPIIVAAFSIRLFQFANWYDMCR
jgi:hypothetical protein